MKKIFSFLLAAAMIVSAIAAVPSNASAYSQDEPIKCLLADRYN